jgi:hypothetical protein
MRRNSLFEILVSKRLLKTSIHITKVKELKVMTEEKSMEDIKKKGADWINKNIVNVTLTKTKPGSISHLLYGEKPSEQSISIKFGHFGEKLVEWIINVNPHFELVPKCNINIKGKKKEVDLLFKNNSTNTIYYRELKANIELDTEKLPATIKKCKDIEYQITQLYPNYTINSGILNWSVYEREELSSGLTHIKTFETHGVNIDHMKNFLEIVQFDWSKKEYYDYFKTLGTIVRNHFEK